MAIDSRIMCINYLDYQKDIKSIIKSAVGKLVVIHNAEILLDDTTRKYISLVQRLIRQKQNAMNSLA